EAECVRKDGKLLPVAITVAPVLDEDGTVVGASAVHRDLAEQRRAFEAARRMEAIVEGSNDAIIGETLDGVITSWNPAAAAMFGYSGEEIIGRSASLLIPEDHAGDAKAIAASVSAGLPVRHVETLNVRKDGTVFPVSLTVSPIRDDGTVIGASVICRDVTEQRQAFEAARRMTAIVEGSQDAILSGSLDGVITSWNLAATRMFGYSSAEMIGKPVEILVPKGLAGEVAAVLEQIKAGQRVQTMQTKRVRKNGTVLPVALTVSPICGADGEVIGVFVIYRDLTR
ncbi:MAG TPA: PAS domain S-box protein, partial [Dermatophilaceae bacterium]